MPQLGESIAEASIVSFLVKPGESVEADQDIIEVETNKATLNLAAPCRGKIEKFVAKVTESYAVGAVLGYLEASAEDAARLGLDGSSPEANGNDTPAPAIEESAAGDGSRKKVQPTVRGLPVPANAAGASYMSPRMKARMAELGLHAADLAGIAGSGAAGRVTIQDFEKFIENPRQLSAYHYPRRYGMHPPVFSRATLLRQCGGLALFISGTASIVGHRSLHIGDIAAQTRETLANIEALLGEANRAAPGARFSLRELACKVYVRRPADLPIIQAELHAALGAGVRGVYLQADICRQDLLVEIEGAAMWPPASA